MKSILLSLFVLLLAVPASAQDDAQPTFIMTYYQCDMGRLDDLIEHERERALPILQALTDDGAIVSAGHLRHQWGDEYNLRTWLLASDMDSALAGVEAYNARYDEMYPDDTLFDEVCPTHRDRINTLQVWSQRENLGPIDPENPPTVAISEYICDYSAMGEIIADYREKAMPIVRALVDEGALDAEGVLTHAWGDEWNLFLVRRAESMSALDSALDTLDERYEAAHGEDAPDLLQEHCSAHKDNIYYLVTSTN